MPEVEGIQRDREAFPLGFDIGFFQGPDPEEGFAPKVGGRVVNALIFDRRKKAFRQFQKGHGSVHIFNIDTELPYTSSNAHGQAICVREIEIQRGIQGRIGDFRLAPFVCLESPVLPTKSKRVNFETEQLAMLARR